MPRFQWEVLHGSGTPQHALAQAPFTTGVKHHPGLPNMRTTWVTSTVDWPRHWADAGLAVAPDGACTRVRPLIDQHPTSGNVQRATGMFECVDQPTQIRIGVVGPDLEANSRFTFGHDGIAQAIDVKPALIERVHQLL
jgi:hypothetical protein